MDFLPEEVFDYLVDVSGPYGVSEITIPCNQIVQNHLIRYRRYAAFKVFIFYPDVLRWDEVDETSTAYGIGMSKNKINYLMCSVDKPTTCPYPSPLTLQQQIRKRDAEEQQKALAEYRQRSGLGYWVHKVLPYDIW